MKQFLSLSWREVTRTSALTVGSPSAHRRETMLKLLSVLVFILTIGIGQVWATEQTITLTYSSFGLTTSYAKKTATVSSIGFTVDQGYKGSGNTIQMNSSKGSGILYNTTAISGLKSIQVNVSSGDKTYTITTGTSEKPTANSQTGTTGGTYNAASGDTYFQLKVSGASYFSSVVITYEESGTPEPTLSLKQGNSAITALNVAATNVANQTITLVPADFASSINSVTTDLYSDAQCSTPITSGAWVNNITVNSGKTAVSFDVNDNNGAQRQCWMKITASDGSKSASATLSITQAKYVAPATLPFSFDGTNDQIAATTGMSQNGIGAYNDAPKLKFDDTGDEIIIFIGSAPYKLTYDIKGNGFSGGTFKVQQSANGTDYADVASYTSLGTTSSKSNDLDETTRYVKFIYTSKSSGNVALGNIAISPVPKTLTSIAVKTAPTKVTYKEGDHFNPIGLVITLTYDDNSTEDVAYSDHESDFTFSPATTDELAMTNTSVSITYADETVSQTITVNPKDKYKVTITEPSNGTVVVKNGEDAIVSGETEIVEGTVLTIVATPSDNYSVEKIYVNGVEQSAYTFTLNANTTVNVTFKEDERPGAVLYLIDANGSGTLTGSHKKGDKVTLPNTAATCAGKTFVGWSSVEITTPATSEPTSNFFEKGQTNFALAEEEQTLYAVYKTEVPGELVTKSDELTRATTGVSNGSTSYSSWSNKSASNTGHSTAVFAGNSAGSNDAIQLRSSGSSSGVVTTTSGGKAKKVTVVWNTNSSSGRTIDIYGKTSAYSAASDLYNSSNQGTKLGSIVCGTSTELTISGDYAFIGIRSNSNALYLDKITIDWTVASASTYTYATTCSPKLDKPTFSPTTGSEFTEATDITISGQTGATIYYTMTSDGSTPADPTTSSNKYTSAINLSANGTYKFKAIAVKANCDDSDVAAASYTLEIPITLAEFLTNKPTTATKVDLTGAVIWAQQTSKSLIFVQQGTSAIALYKYNHDKTGWVFGKKISGIVTAAKYNLYNGMPEMNISDFGTATVVDAEESDYPDPLVITDENAEASLVVTNAFRLAKMENVKFGKDDNYVTISTENNTIYYEDELNVLTEALPNPATPCTVIGIIYPYESSSTAYYDQLAPLSKDDISTGLPKAVAILPTVSEESGAVALNKVVVVTPQEGMTTTLKIGEAEATTITAATNVTIDVDKSIVVTASAYYYTDNSKTYTYTVDESLTERAIAIDENITNGSVSANKASAANNTTITLTATPAQHYHLLSWNVYETETPTNTIAVTNNTFTMPAAAVTVSATFEEDDYATVTFDGGSATSGSVADQKVYVNEYVTMPANGYVYAGHSFNGWKLGNDVYAVGDATYKVTTTGTITFTADWDIYPWGNPGKWELVTDASTLAVDDYIVIACQSKTAVAGNIANDLMAVETANVTFSTDKSVLTSIGNAEVMKLGGSSSAWTLANASGEQLGATAVKKLAWDNGTQTWTISIEDEEHGYKATIQNTTTSPTDYGRMMYNQNNQNPRFTTYTSNESASMILPHLYKFVAGAFYTITYATGTNDAVTNMPAAQVTANDGTATLSDQEPIRVGYIFNNWSDGTNTYAPNDNVTLEDNVTLTAQWTKALKYTLTYNINGGTIASGNVPASTEYDLNEEVTVTSAELEKDGLMFAGWEYNGHVYVAGAKFAMPAEDVILSARFVKGAVYTFPSTNQGSTTAVGEPEGATFTYVNNGGYNSSQVQLTSSNGAMTLTLSGYDLLTINAITLNMRSNGNDGAGTFSATIGGNSIAELASATTFDHWFDNTSYGTTNRDVHVSMTPTRVQQGQNIVITLNGTTNSLYIKSVTIEYEVVLDEILSVIPGSIGTYCPKKEVKYPAGATFFTMAYVKFVNNVPYKVYFDEIAEDESLQAGHPYFYIAEEESIQGIKVGTDASVGINDHGFIGCVDIFPFAVTDESSRDKYYVVHENQIKRCTDGYFRLGAEKAYVDMKDSSLITREEDAPAPAPGRRRASISNAEAPQVATDIYELYDDAAVATKVILNGQMFIIRGGQMYDATGCLVK